MVSLCILGILVTLTYANNPIITPTLTGAGKQVPIDISDMRFTPNRIQIDKGTTVTWINFDKVDHMVSFKNGPSSPVLHPGESWSFTFGVTDDEFEQAKELVYTDPTNPQMKGVIAPLAVGSNTLDIMFFNVPAKLFLGVDGGTINSMVRISNGSQISETVESWTKIYLINKPTIDNPNGAAPGVNPNLVPNPNGAAPGVNPNIAPNPNGEAPIGNPNLVPNPNGAAPSVDVFTTLVQPMLAVKASEVVAAGGSAITTKSILDIPGKAPTGTYLVVSYVGSYPNLVRAYTTFKFDKTDKKAVRRDTTIVNPMFPRQENVNNPTLSSTVSGETMLSINHYPEPFNPSTQISFTLPAEGFVQLDVYNLQGAKVTSLVNGTMQAGQHSVTFNAANLPTGLYIYRLAAAGQSLTGKMMLIK